MPSAAAVIACALALLGRADSSMPPIVLVDAPPRHASIQTEAFVSPPDRHIYIVTSSPVFRDALATRSVCSRSIAMKKIASILVHEEWHMLHGTSEEDAYIAQLSALLRMGVSPDNLVYKGVHRSMLAVLKKKKQKPDLVLASK
jgi:hypothetical protein